jgi:competence protein ComEC
VLRAFPVSKIIIAPQTRQHQTKPLSFVLDVATKNNIPIIDAASGWSESLGELTLSILSPRIDDVYRTSNGSSIVLLLEAHGRNIVLTGDIDGTTIGQLVERLPKSVDLIELPHHGQWGRQVQSMINNHRPRFVIQSTNVARFAKDRWKFPEDCDRFVTAIDGTITTTIFTNGDITISGSSQPVSMNECLSSHY